MSKLPRKDNGGIMTKMSYTISSVSRKEIMTSNEFYCMKEIYDFLDVELHGKQLSRLHCCKEYPLSKARFRPEKKSTPNPSPSLMPYVSLVVPGKLNGETQPGTCRYMPMIILDMQGENVHVFIFDSNQIPIIPFKGLCPTRGYHHIYKKEDVTISPLKTKNNMNVVTFFVNFIHINRNKSHF